MKNNYDEINDDDLMDVARRWYLRLEDEAEDDQMLDQFEQWLLEDASHREAFDRVVDFWVHIDNMPEIQEMRAEEAENKEENPSQADEGVIVEFVPKNTVHKGPGRWADTRKWAVAASVFFFLSMMVGFYNFYLPEGTYRTAAGEQEVVHLADGSVVYLNTRSKLRVDFSGELRKVSLLQGEARFDVAKDKSRPFVVETSKGSVRAVGTSFNIYDNEKVVEVIVLEGKVAVNHPHVQQAGLRKIPQTLQGGIILSQGEKIIAQEKYLTNIQQANQLEITQKNAWREGKVIFRGQSLSQAVEELSRYTNKKIMIIDDVTADMKMGGAFDVKDLDAFLHAIEDTFPVKIIRFTPFVTLIVEA